MSTYLAKDSMVQQFNENAEQYDSQRSKLIPCFNDFYSIPISIMNTPSSKPKVLDIGSGTGLFSSFILQKYPEAEITLIDLSEKMMERAKKRFANFSNMRYITADYTTFPFNETFDIIVSSLSIHHLTDQEKKHLYQRVFSILKKDGLFLNADQVLGHTPFLETLYKNDWKEKVENSGLSEEEIDSAYERTKLDQMSTLDDQLDWLKESGFKDVDCLYKYFSFVVLFGRK